MHGARAHRCHTAETMENERKPKRNTETRQTLIGASTKAQSDITLMNWFNLFISRHGRKAFGLQLCMHVCPTFDILIAALRVDVCPLLLFGAWGCWDKTQTDFSQRVLSHHPAMLETHLQNFSKPHMIPNSIANRKLVESDLVSPKYISFCTALLPGMAEGWWQHKWGETICWQVQSRVYNGD